MNTAPPAQKLATWLDMAKGYGVPVDAATVAQLINSGNVDLEAINQHLSGQGQPRAAAQPQVDPETLVRQAEERAFVRFQQQQAAERTQHINAQLQRLEGELEFFSDPKIQRAMTGMIASGAVPRSGDPVADAKAAYEAAVWAEPSTRAVLAQREQAAARGTSQRPTVSPSPRPQPAGAPRTQKPTTLRGVLEAAWDAHHGGG
jgi:hypothetical protein